MTSRLRGRLRELRGFPDQPRLRRRGLQVGHDVYLGHRVALDSGFLWLITIGDETTLSAGVRVLVHDASTTRHLGYTRIAPVRIGRRVYVGADAVVLPGVTIGDDAIVGAGSVVTRDVAAGTVVAGNPARQLATTADYVARQRPLVGTRPTFPLEGHTIAGGVTAEGMERMREALRTGPGFVR